MDANASALNRITFRAASYQFDKASADDAKSAKKTTVPGKTPFDFDGFESSVEFGSLDDQDAASLFEEALGQGIDGEEDLDNAFISQFQALSGWNEE